jgi:hypothetical protein
MRLQQWFRDWLMPPRTRQASRPRSPRYNHVRLRLELLEDRTLPSTFTVLNLNDSGPGSLRAEVAAANATAGSNTIGVADQVHGTITLTSGELLIKSSITINGPGANQLAVSGGGTSRVFEIATGFDVSISGLTIADGKAADTGGGILNDGSNLTLTGDELTHNVAFESATSAARGGAMRSLAGALTIRNCRITDNQALAAGGASAFGDALGGGLYVLAGSATITGSTISGNLAQGGAGSSDGFSAGGGIDCFAPLILTDSTLSDNRAAGGDNAPATSGAGGALDVSGGGTISGTTFSDNVSFGGNGGTGPFVGEAEGAAIADFGPNGSGSAAPLAISDSTFVNNQAIGGNGGNSGPGQADPSVDQSYGVIFNFGGTVDISRSRISHNKSIGGNNGTATGTDIVEVGVAEGGAICNEIGAAATVTDCFISDNQAIGGDANTGSGPVVHVGAGFGAGIFSGFGGTGSIVGSNTLTVSNTEFEHNISQGGDNNTGTASVIAEVGAGVGAAIMNDLGGSAMVSNSELEHNRAVGGRSNTAGGTGAIFAGLAAGAGIFNDVGNYNSSGYGAFDPSVVTVSGDTIAFNLAQACGGNAEGGGLANVLSATTTVTASTLTNNHANGDGGAGLGGGAYNDATSTLTLTASEVTRNHANGSPGIGGGVYNLGTFTIDALTVIGDNHASTSGDDIGP